MAKRPVIQRQADLWLPRKLVAAALRISPRQFDEKVRPDLPPDAIRGSGRTLRIYLPDAIDARIEQKAGERKRPVAGGDETDPLLMGYDSPALERYRLARAKREELQLEELRKRLVDRTDLRKGWALVASQLRQAVENLQRLHGQEAADLVVEALEEADGSVQEITHVDDDDDSEAGG
jgi:hypothetical protein